MRSKCSSSRHSKSSSLSDKAKINFFKTFKREKKYDEEIMKMRDEAGMENELLEKVGKMNFNTQVEAFYTAYSKVRISPPTQTHFWCRLHTDCSSTS